MTTFKITDKNHPLHGREFEEYDKFKRYNGGVEWVPLLIGANQVKFFALCNLKAVDAQPVIEVTQEAIDQLSTELFETPAAATYRPAWEVNPRALVVYVPPKPLVVKMPADLIGHIREALYCDVKAA